MSVKYMGLDVRLRVFAAEEKGALRDLPEHRWEPTTWFQCIVGRDLAH